MYLPFTALRAKGPSWPIGAPQDNEAQFEVAETHCFRAESLGMHLTKKKQRELAPL